MNNECCTAIKEASRSQRIGQLLDDVAALSFQVKDETETLHTYLHGPVPRENCKDNVSAGPSGFYEHLERQLHYIRNNLSDIRQLIKESE